MPPESPPVSNRHYVRFYNVRSTSVTSSSRHSRRLTATVNNHVDVLTGTYRRRTHFMDACLKDYHLMLKTADKDMKDAIKQMPLTKWE